MEAGWEKEEKEKLISECLKWKIELKKLKKRWRVKNKRNLRMKRHNKVLNDQLVVLRRLKLEDGDYQMMIAVEEGRVVLKNNENFQEWKITDQQTNKNCYIITDKIFKCQHPGCDKKYAKKTHLYIHMVIHAKRFQCQLCQKCFHSQSNLKIHLRIHTGERPFECDLVGCGKKFKQKEHLKSHVNKHNEERPFKCSKDGCKKFFKTNYNLQLHLKTHHSSVRLFECSFPGCEKSYKTKKDLGQHVQYTHKMTEKRFQCDKKGCGKWFWNHNQLNEHHKSHSSIRSYQCQECDRKYKYIQDLNEHVLLKHSAETSKFQCNNEDCREIFKTRRLLMKHKKIHG